MAAPSESEENADWMSRMPDELLDVPLWDLAIPGSHDTMSYCLDLRSPVLDSESGLLRLLDRLFPKCTRRGVYRWATTQAVSLTDQCNAGVRFLDLRIANKISRETGSELYFYHAIYTLLPVKEALYKLASWLNSHPREVMIVALSHFYQLDYDDHSLLISFLTHLFKDKLIPPQDTPTLRTCWALGRQVIISYDNDDMVCQHPQLWSGILYRYADSPNVNTVISYLEKEKAKGRPGGFFVTGLNLTVGMLFVLFHPRWTMRRLTQASLQRLLDWLAWQNPGPQPTGLNVICCDFVALSQFCSLVIQLNLRLLARTPR